MQQVEKYKLILEQFLKYGKAKKCWDSMLKRMSGKYKEMLEDLNQCNFEEFNFSKTKNGNRNWQVLNYSTDYMHITVKKDNLIFHLKVFDRDLENIVTRLYFELTDRVDSDCLIFFEVEDVKTKQRKMYDYCIAKTEKEGYLTVFREWIQKPRSYDYDTVEEIRKMSEEEFNSIFTQDINTL